MTLSVLRIVIQIHPQSSSHSPVSPFVLLCCTIKTPDNNKSAPPVLLQTGGAHILSFRWRHAKPAEFLFPRIFDSSLGSCSDGRESKISLASRSVFSSSWAKNSLIPFTEGTQFPFCPPPRGWPGRRFRAPNGGTSRTVFQKPASPGKRSGPPVPG